MAITKQEFCSKIDHSILGWECARDKVKQYCDEVLEFGFASVCVNPDYVSYCASILQGRAGVTCVCGFPCGANTIKTKIAEGLEAIENGATDLDCVTNYGLLRNGDDRKLLEEYKAFVQAVKDKKPETVVKYIIYAPYGTPFVTDPFLTEDETKRLAEMVIASGADYIKFFCNVRQIKPLVNERIKMKFSGAIDLPVSIDAIEQGCDRVGADSAAIWLRETPDEFWKK